MVHFLFPKFFLLFLKEQKKKGVCGLWPSNGCLSLLHTEEPIREKSFVFVCHGKKDKTKMVNKKKKERKRGE